MKRDISDTEFLCALKEILSAVPDATQREIALRTDISLGLVNGLLSELSCRGWIQAVPVGGRKIRYSLTAEGAAVAAGVREEKMRRDFAQMRRYAEAVTGHLYEAKERGYTRVALYGESGIEFLIGYACWRNGMAFDADGVAVRDENSYDEDDVLRIIGENERDDEVPEACLSVFELAGR